MNTYKQRVQQFFDRPLIQGLLMLFIVISSASIAIEFFFHNIAHEYALVFHIIEYTVLPIFTLEYTLRLWAAPKRLAFIRKPFNSIDLLAIVPSYIEIILSVTPAASALRTLRLIRLLRFSRLLRAFKLFRYKSFANDVFSYQDTILQSITPVILAFVGAKSVILALEHYGLWIHNTNLSELFAIIGFALGIILSQKIGTTHEKFTHVEEAAVRIYSTLETLNTIAPNPVYSSWAKNFLTVLNRSAGADRTLLTQDTRAIFEIIHRIEPQPSELTILYTDFVNDMHFCLSKSQRLTPKAYDALLHQSTITYLALIAVFIPGVTGLLSVLIATYILYGMYRVTQDLDSIAGGEYQLINIHLDELQQLADSH